MLSLGFAIFFAVIVALLLVYAVWDTVRKKQQTSSRNHEKVINKHGS